MNKYLMGLDNGGSEIKCGLYKTNGSEILCSSVNVEMHTPSVGFTERDMDEIWRANCDLIFSVISESGVDAGDIIGLSVTGYGNGINFIDENGDPVYPSIVSTDSRAVMYMDQWKRDGTERIQYENTLQQCYASQPPAIIAWFRDNKKNVLDRAAYALQIKDYIRYKLTGKIAAEITDISNTGTYDIIKNAYAAPVFEAAGIAPYYRLFPGEVISPVDLAGKVSANAADLTGLNEGTLVAGGLFDIDACCLSSGVLQDDTLCLVAGTWCINEYITEDINQGIGKMSTTASFLKNRYLISDSSATGLSNFNWYLENFYQYNIGLSGAALYEECDRRVASMMPEDSGVLFIPYLFASSTNPNSKGTFLNMSSYHGADDLLRAIYEGIVFSSASHVMRLEKNRGPFNRIRLSGGIMNSDVWCQMISDVFQIPAEIVGAKQLGTLGAAICAGVLCGVWGDFEEAVRDTVSVHKTFYPDAGKKDVYKKKFHAYRRAVKAVDCFYSQSIDE